MEIGLKSMEEKYTHVLLLSINYLRISRDTVDGIVLFPKSS